MIGLTLQSINLLFSFILYSSTVITAFLLAQAWEISIQSFQTGQIYILVITMLAFLRLQNRNETKLYLFPSKSNASMDYKTCTKGLFKHILKKRG